MLSGDSVQRVSMVRSELVFFHLLFFVSSLTGQTQVLNENDYRLPLDVDSISYNLTLDPDLKDFTFRGTLIFTFRPLKTTDRLVLNAKNLFFDRTQLHVSGLNGQPVGVVSFDEVKELERVILVVSSPFQENHLYSAVFQYSGNITDDGAGLYRSSYTDENGLNQWMVVSQLRPVHARKVFPCLDEPQFRAVIRLSVLHQPTHHVVSNMPVNALHTSLLASGEERSLTVFQDTPRIPVFLVGVLISGLPATLGRDGFISLAVPASLSAAAYSAQIGPALAAAMVDLVGIPYPQVKTHQVALPRLVPVAMENWGLFNFREENILYEAGVSPSVQKQTAARFSGHEVAHAWLGNSVTIAWWDYLWLSEVFAMYLEYYLPHRVEPTWRMEEQMAVDLAQSGLADDSPSATPLTTRVLTPSQISAKFAGLTYTKGPGLLRMVEHILTKANFFKGIRTYLIKHWDGSVTPVDLWSILETEGKLPTKLETIMAGWTDQPGYPLVSVDRHNGVARLSQSPFFPVGGGAAVNRSSGWWIPISYTTSSHLESLHDTRPRAWLQPGVDLQIPLVHHTDWILVNLQLAGFYRVNYDSNNWAQLSRQLQTDYRVIPPLNRAALLDDCLSLAEAGLLDYTTALSLASYLSLETDFIVWKSAVRPLLRLADRLVHTPLYPIYQTYLLSLVDLVYKTSDLVDSVVDDHTDRVRRETVVRLACEMDSEHCKTAAERLLSQLMAGKQQRISVDVRESLMCRGVREGGRTEWQFVLELLSRQTNLRRELTRVLACTPNPDILKSYLIDSIADLSEADWLSRVTVFASRRDKVDLILRLLHDNISLIISRFGTKGLSSALIEVSKLLTTKKQVETLSDLERLGANGLESSRRSVEQKVAWLEARLPSITAFFKGATRYGLLIS